MTLEQIARVTYEANRAYADTLGEPPLPFETVVESVIKGVEAIIADPSITPQELHRRWFEEKLLNGWVYGPVKDAKKKIHPQMVHYAQLPEAQRVKDYLFQAIVRVLANLPKGYVQM